MELRDCKVNLCNVTREQRKQVIACLEFQNENMYSGSCLYNDVCGDRTLKYDNYDNTWYAYHFFESDINITLKEFLKMFSEPKIKFTI